MSLPCIIAGLRRTLAHQTKIIEEYREKTQKVVNSFETRVVDPDFEQREYQRIVDLMVVKDGEFVRDCIEPVKQLIQEATRQLMIVNKYLIKAAICSNDVNNRKAVVIDSLRCGADERVWEPNGGTPEEFFNWVDEEIGVLLRRVWVRRCWGWIDMLRVRVAKGTASVDTPVKVRRSSRQPEGKAIGVAKFLAFEAPDEIFDTIMRFV